jgi:alkyldihydroxyacetonephosphate synthase
VSGGTTAARPQDEGPVPQAQGAALPGGGVIAVTGGKLTTYRKMAADTVDAAVEVLGRGGRSRTRRLRLHGAEGHAPLLEPEAASRLGIPAAELRRLADRYGGDARTVAAMIAADPDLARPLVATLPHTRAEARFAARYEMVGSLDDLLARRIPARWLARDASADAAEDAARLVADDLGWDEDRITREVAAFRASVEQERESAGLPRVGVGAALPEPDVTDLRPAPGAVTPPITLEGGGEPTGSSSPSPCTSTPPSSSGWRTSAPTSRWPTRGPSPRQVVTGGPSPWRGRWRATCRRSRLRSPGPRAPPRWPPSPASADEARVPLTAAGGRSGVSGASIPVHGGVVLDCTAMSGITAVDAVSGTIDVLPGTFGDALEEELRASHGLTLGHWPQSIALSTVGGWLACRSAGQLSTRYGKIEDMVVGMEVVLADGTVVETGGAPRAAVGPDLNQLFVGSEGTLGIITSARLRCHPAPDATRQAAYAFPSFPRGSTRCGRSSAGVPRRRWPGSTTRSRRTGAGRRATSAVLLVLDEGDPVLVDATLAIVADACRGAEPLDAGLVDRWLSHRNDTSALQALTRKGFVVDTMEIAGPWSALPSLYQAVLTALQGVDGMLAASAHQSHSYLDGGCLYFSFAGRPAPEDRERFYVAAWDAATAASLAGGGALSHHHGVGLNRSRFMASALGAGMDVLTAVKSALDPNGILNPGKLGLPSPFGQVTWPTA